MTILTNPARPAGFFLGFRTRLFSGDGTRHLGPFSTLLLVLIANEEESRGEPCFLYDLTLAEKIGVDRSTLRELRDELVSCGWLHAHQIQESQFSCWVLLPAGNGEARS